MKLTEQEMAYLTDALRHYKGFVKSSVNIPQSRFSYAHYEEIHELLQRLENENSEI